MQFEWPSRGLDSDGAVSFGNIAATDRKVIVTGFDPFQLPGQPDQSNPSGLLALILNSKKVDQVSPDTYATTAIFPVRYRDFDDGLVEKAVKKVVTPQFALVRMLMTLSLNNSDCYDLERWACQARLTTFDDNEGKKPTNVVAGTKTFYQNTLPYERVITSTDTTRRLAGPSRTSTPFVTDQSYKVSGASGSRPRGLRPTPSQMPPVVEGSFRPEPVDDGAVHEAAAYEKQFDQPNGTSLEGSGGSYLSNEIFYRSARERDDGTRKTLASGHLHLPFVSPANSWDRDGMISGVKEALRKLLNNVFALRTAAGDADLPVTPITRTSQITLSVKNDSPATVKLTAAEVPAPFAVAIAGAVPQQVNADGSVSLSVSFSPTALGDFRGEVLLKDGTNLVGSITLVGRASAAPPAPVISGFSPDSGPVGTTLTIDGDHLDSATRVAIAGVTITKLTNTNTQITARVTGGLRTGPVSVTTPSGTATTSDSFTVISIRHPPEDLAAQLVARRQELELNPEEAAAQIGAKPGTYRRWEQGKDKPSARFHPAIVTFLGHDPDRDPREFGEQIKAARERDGLTRAQLAQRLNVSSSTVKAWEAGTVSRPSPRVSEIFENYVQEEE
jgi:DNA-binding transcriptional regulator YiaG/pyrrolidone-carboxylate peptidase